jgi:hypothetical protein
VTAGRLRLPYRNGPSLEEALFEHRALLLDCGSHRYAWFSRTVSPEDVLIRLASFLPQLRILSELWVSADLAGRVVTPIGQAIAFSRWQSIPSVSRNSLEAWLPKARESIVGCLPVTRSSMRPPPCESGRS